MYDEDLKNLEEWIRRLKIDYDIFFVGNRKKPPDELKLRVEKTLKRLSEASDMSLSQRFLYNTLIARFYVYRDLWRRTQQERESAEEVTRTPALSKRTLSSDARNEPIPREIQVSISNPENEADNIRRLYDQLLRMKGAEVKQSPDISYQQFAAYIANKTLGIKDRHRCNSVTFRIALEDNTIKFLARADSSSG